MKKKYFKKMNNNGITLIALVITIIVLLILAGVSIAMLTGENGVLTKATEAKEENEKSTDKELIRMAMIEAQIGEYNHQELESSNLQKAIENQFGERKVVVSDNIAGNFIISCLDTLIDYKITGNQVEEFLNWNEKMETAKAPASQNEERNEAVIGIGSSGEAVDMDLWEYTLLEDGTYALNTEENLNTDASAGITAGYKGGFSEDGKIEGEIPQYISEDNGKTYKEVTNLKWLFFNCSEMKIAPKIPATAKKINYTFRKCTNLSSTPFIPNGVTEMSRTFQECENLEKVINISFNTIDLSYAFDTCRKLRRVPDIPENVTKINATFNECNSLEIAPKLSENIEDMNGTFIYCTNLKSLSSAIPNSVINMNRTFYACRNLSGEIEINANLTGKIVNEANEKDYDGMFSYAITNENCKIILTGNCKMLSEIVAQSNNPNITLKQ